MWNNCLVNIWALCSKESDTICWCYRHKLSSFIWLLYNGLTQTEVWILWNPGRKNLASCSSSVAPGQLDVPSCISFTHWQLQRVLTPFPQDKVWNAGRRKREQPGRNLSETDSLGKAQEQNVPMTSLWETTFCFSRINPEGSQGQEPQKTHRRSTFTCWPQQDPHFAW